MSRLKVQSPAWKLWLWWVFANSAGLLLGVALGLALGPVAISVARTLGVGVSDDERIAMGMIPTIGPSLAIAQSLTLRKHLPQARWWVLATTVGWVAGAATVFTVVPVGFAPRLVEYVVSFGTIGLVLGVAQWPVLRRQVPHAGWWVLASLVGWAGVPLVFGRAITSTGELAAVVALSPAITGFVLIQLLRQQLSQVSDLGQSAA